MPGSLAAIKPSPSMPALPTSSRRALLPLTGKSSLPPRAAIPSFQSTTEKAFAPNTPSIPAPAPSGSLPLARSSSSSSLPSSQPGSAALAAFLAAKQGEELTPEDFEVIDALTRNMKHGSQAGSPPKNERYGGWAAGTFRSTPGASRPYSTREAGGVSGVFAEPSNGFSLGRDTPTKSLLSNGRPTPVYLGPGMSPRRMLPSIKKPGLRPLITFDHQKKVEEQEQEDVEATAKKRKLVGGAAKDIPTPVPSASISSSRSMPNLSAAAESSSMAAARAASRHFEGSPAPAPVAETPRPSAVAIGKKRAADIMLELIQQDEETGGHKTPEPMIFNPYDRSHLRKSSSQSGGSSNSQSTPNHKVAAPGKSILRSSTSTPLRGAAARLEASRTKSTNFFDRFKSSAVGQTSPQKAVRIELPDGAAENEVEHYNSPDDYMVELQKKLEIARKAARESQRLSAAIARRAVPALYREAEEQPVVENDAEVTPLPAPQLETREQALPSPRPAVTMAEEVPSALVPTPPQEAATPKFSTSFSLAPPPMKEDDTVTSPPTEPSVSLPRSDADAVYLSARDAALAVAEAALPFYPFTLPSVPKPSQEDSTARAKAEAMKRAAPTYEFKMPEPGDESSPAMPADQGVTQIGLPGSKKPQLAPRPWKCSLCGAPNLGSVIDKCQFCDIPRPPRPTSAPSAPPASTSVPTSTSNFTPFSLPLPQAPKVDGEWTCAHCMLKQPAAMTEKCSICDCPRSKPAGLAPSSPTNLSQAPIRLPTAPNFALPPRLTQKKDDGGWDCPECMIRNPAMAVDKCLACEHKRP
ncbi:hypothetical protein EHS25_009238 [Saitozyma podzolica]|uniref:RanBP2-type domain-containing protein n=1 Tax=Saitozyma podzolica TaxID=1890683 RepID=A0A427YL76_9TREE|nr:hypothetical protein EHS25_009238 [Saitozyma podzolica]